MTAIGQSNVDIASVHHICHLKSTSMQMNEQLLVMTRKHAFLFIFSANP